MDNTESSSQGFLGSVPDDHSDQSASSDQTPMFLRDHPELQRKSPWQPIVLSLDGGGIRGLSALYILQELMSKIREEEKRLDELQPREGESIAGESSAEWNICHYVDFIVGTSTGGLIAVLLGRLRLDIDTCINIYEQVGTYIFQRRRWWRKTLYDHSRIEDAVKTILTQYCEERQTMGKHRADALLRQWDFSHLDGNTFKNYSCKVALMAFREGGKNHYEGDKTHLFRSYDHVEAEPSGYDEHDVYEVSPGTVQSDTTMIWEACRATSAAPFYFDKMIIRGVRYMDGGICSNNPANFALNEARQMANRSQQREDAAAALISIGTGRKKPQSGFQNIFSMLKWAQRRITDTQDAHNSVQEKCGLLQIPYFRFDVIHGLSEMPMDECKKNRTKKKMAKPISQEKKVMSDATHVDMSANRFNRFNPFKWKPAESSKSRLFPTYDPERYEYTTYERIKLSTLHYCRDMGGEHNNEVNTSAELSKLAKLLVYYRRQREASSGDDWRRFAEHPYKRVNGELMSRNS